MSKQPWLKFYPTDWRADPALRMCSLAARGLWIEMLCVMHEADPYGHLLVNGQTVTDTQLGALVGVPPDQIAALLGELEAAGVFSRSRAGVIYSRKLSRMKKKAATARNNGRKGGNPNLSKEKENSASVNPPDKGRDKPQKPEARDQSYIDGGGGDAHARDLPENPPVDPPPKDPPKPPPLPLDPTDRERILRAIGADPVSGLIGPNGKCLGKMADMQEAQRWQADHGLTFEEVLTVVGEVMAKKPDGPPSSFRYFSSAMQRAAAEKTRPPLTPSQGDSHEPDHHRRGGWSPSTPAGRAHASIIAGFARAASDD